MKYEPIKGTLPAVCWKKLADLYVDPRYQRSTNSVAARRLIGEIAQKWDWRLCAPLTVSLRKDTQGRQTAFVIDGQHRLEAAMMRGDIPELPCIVSTFDSYEDEALAFVAINSARRAVTKLDRFHARIAAGEEKAVEVDNLVKNCGLVITRENDATEWKPKDIAFPDDVASAIARSYVDAQVALEMLAQIYYDQPLLRGRDLFAGLVELVHRTGGKVRHETASFAKHLRSKLQAQWCLSAQRLMADDGLERHVAMAAAMVEDYPLRATCAPRLSTLKFPAGVPKAALAPAPAPKNSPTPVPESIKRIAANITLPKRGEASDDTPRWCSQCEKKVRPSFAQGCKDRFCKVK